MILYRCSIRLVRFAKNERRLIKFIPTKKLIRNLKKREINLYTYITEIKLLHISIHPNSTWYYKVKIIHTVEIEIHDFSTKSTTQDLIPQVSVMCNKQWLAAIFSFLSFIKLEIIIKYVPSKTMYKNLCNILSPNDGMRVKLEYSFNKYFTIVVVYPIFLFTWAENFLGRKFSFVVGHVV